MKIFCIGRNYSEHAKELNNDIPEKPIVFMKPTTALLKGNKDFYIPEFSNNVHYEAEIVVKIGKNGKYVNPKFALSYVKEITIGLDLTARDLQNELKAKGHPWEIAKGFDGSAVIGTFVPLGEKAFNEISFHLTKNGEVVQKGFTKDMIFKIEELIAYISTFFTLQTGDLIFTGTPAGVGQLKIGEMYEGFIEEKKLLQTQIK